MRRPIPHCGRNPVHAALICLGSLAVLVGCLAGPLQAQESQPTSRPAKTEVEPAPPSLQPGLPTPKEFARHLRVVMASYPADGTHGYHWPKTGRWAGNARDLSYRGEEFAKGDPRGRCHCCGLTFEAFLQGWQRWAKANGQPDRAIPGVPDHQALRRLRSQWFGSDGNRMTLLHAVESHGLGVRVRRWQDARSGDFVQLWRHSGSGHSVVFLGWEMERGKRTGIRYWSTQGSTKGIGTRIEPIAASVTDAASKKAVDPAQLYIVRIGDPRRGEASRKDG